MNFNVADPTVIYQDIEFSFEKNCDVKNISDLKTLFILALTDKQQWPDFLNRFGKSECLPGVNRTQLKFRTAFLERHVTVRQVWRVHQTASFYWVPENL